MTDGAFSEVEVSFFVIVTFRLVRGDLDFLSLSD